MKNRKVVVTGGAGFIGSNICEELCDENEVVAIDNLSTGNYGNIKELVQEKRIDFVDGTINDLKLLNSLFDGVDYVLHQAAIPSVPRSVADPIASNEANISGTLNVLVAARDNNVEKVVFASSSSVYGDAPVLPKEEGMSPHPMSPYAVSKLACEHYCEVFESIYGLKSASLRYFNVYGPRQDPTSTYAAVVPNFFTRLLNDKPPIIYGDGKQSRDFTFVKDVVQANVKTAQSKATGVYNIAGGGKGTTVNELADIIMELVGKIIVPIHEKERPGDVKHSLADITKARKAFDYMPKYSIEKGLKETMGWYR
ncbi:MAG: SDR family oxidoreductase [Candidatus Methanofastidiosia archaeon]